MNQALPAKKYVYNQHHILDATRWDGYVPRRDDIIVTTSLKAGTTWMMTIVANLLFENGQFPEPVDTMAPWIEMRVMPVDAVFARLEAQTHRRFLKSHAPLHAMPYFDECRYIVVGRDARDVFMSLVNHHASYTEGFFQMLGRFDEELGRAFPRDLGDIHDMWKTWMTRGWFENESDGYPYWSHLTHCQSWWDFKHLPNILFVHFNDLLQDPATEIQRIAAHLAIAVDEARMGDILARVSFDRMKQEFDQIMPDASMIWRGGGKDFMHKGTNGRWQGVLSDAELLLYEKAVQRVLSTDAAHWLANGRAGTEIE